MEEMPHGHGGERGEEDRGDEKGIPGIKLPTSNYFSLLVPQKVPFFSPSLCALNPIKAPHLLCGVCGEEPNPRALVGPAPSCSSALQISKRFCQSTENILDLLSWLSPV